MKKKQEKKASSGWITSIVEEMRNLCLPVDIWVWERCTKELAKKLLQSTVYRYNNYFINIRGELIIISSTFHFRKCV